MTEQASALVLIVIPVMATPEQVPAAIIAIDPPNVPGFIGTIRVAVDEPRGEKTASTILSWLDEPLEATDD